MELGPTFVVGFFMTIGSGSCAGTFGTYAGFALGLIRYLIHYRRRKHCIHAPAALRLSARGFGLFHGTNIRFVTDRTTGRVNGFHRLLAYQLRRALSIQDFADVAEPVELAVPFVASALA